MGKRTCGLILLICFLLAMVSFSYAAEREGENQRRIETGFMTGYGTGGTCDGNYEPLLLIFHLGYTFKDFSLQGGARQSRLSFILEPQYNLVFRPHRDYEFGLGLGFKYMHPLTDRLEAYLLVVTGPHYISAQSDDQAHGFIFSNAVGAGLYYFLKPNLAVNAGYRLRHISNAGTRHPNIGIDSNFGMIGISWFF